MKSTTPILLLATMLLMLACATQRSTNAAPPAQPIVIIDTGVQLSAGHYESTEPLAAGQYEFEVTSTDGVTIMTYPSIKDFEIVKANGEGAEYLSTCSATKNIRFHQTCTLPQGAVFTIKNPNFLASTNLNIKVTKLP